MVWVAAWLSRNAVRRAIDEASMVRVVLSYRAWDRELHASLEQARHVPLERARVAAWAGNGGPHTVAGPRPQLGSGELRPVRSAAQRPAARRSGTIRCRGRLARARDTQPGRYR